MGRNSYCVAAEQVERGMCIPKARVTVLPANTPRAKKVNMDIFGSNCGRSPTLDWLVTRMPVNRPFYERFQRRGRRLLPIHLRRFTQSSALLNFQVINAPRSLIC